MLMFNGSLRFSKEVKILRRISKSTRINHDDSAPIIKKFRADKILNILSNTSIKPFLNATEIKRIKKYYKSKKEITSTYSFVVDENVARDIVHNVLKNTINEDKQVIIEGNPGLGLITINLIKCGISNIYLFESEGIGEVSLNQLCEHYSDIITKQSVNMLVNPQTMLLSAFDHCSKIGVPVTIIGICHNLCFLRGVVLNYIQYKLWETKLTVFLVLGSAAFERISEQENTTAFRFYLNCLLTHFFVTEEIAKYPANAFLPLCNSSNDDMHLIKISHNKNVFKLIDKDEVQDFYLFLNVLSSSNENFIISTLEKWIPNCGPYLISKGVSMIMQAKELSPQEALTLFTIIKEFDEYENYKILASNFLEK